MIPELTYAIGDIHGCCVQFETLLREIDVHAAGRTRKIITLGDYCDRGPDARGVYEILMSRKDIIALCGNHERMMQEARHGDAYIRDWWKSHGGKATLKSFEVDRPSAIPGWYWTFIESLPLMHEDDLRVFVHGGLNPWRPTIAEQVEKEILWIRDEFLNWPHPFPKYVVHGHTPQISGVPDVRPNRANLDTCCFSTGILTCAVFDNERAKPIEFIQANHLGNATVLSAI